MGHSLNGLILEVETNRKMLIEAYSSLALQAIEDCIRWKRDGNNMARRGVAWQCNKSKAVSLYLHFIFISDASFNYL